MSKHKQKKSQRRAKERRKQVARRKHRRRGRKRDPIFEAFRDTKLMGQLAVMEYLLGD